MSQTHSKKPTHGVFITKPGKDNKAIWTRIGAAWTHKDGSGFSIKLDALPVNGEVVVREITEKDETAGAA